MTVVNPSLAHAITIYQRLDQPVHQPVLIRTQQLTNLFTSQYRFMRPDWTNLSSTSQPLAPTILLQGIYYKSLQPLIMLTCKSYP